MNELISRFDAAFYDLWEPYPEPTAASLEAIETKLRFKLPNLLVEFAQRSTRFSNFFLGLGPDFGNHSHILRKNEQVRTDGDWLQLGSTAPDHLVFITENFMENFFWCLDTSRSCGEYPIVLWAPEPRSKEPGIRYESFEEFVVSQVQSFEATRSSHGAN